MATDMHNVAEMTMKRHCATYAQDIRNMNKYIDIYFISMVTNILNKT